MRICCVAVSVFNGLFEFSIWNDWVCAQSREKETDKDIWASSHKASFTSANSSHACFIKR